MSGKAIAAACILAILPLAPVRAQAGTESPVAAATRMASAGDTVGAIRFLQNAVERDRRNAHAWYLLGRLAWDHTRTAKPQGAIMMDPAMARLRMVADSALRYAAQLSPDSARYWYDLGKFALATGNTFVRAGSPGFFENAATSAAKTGDSALLSRALDEQGMRSWRLYQNIANRVLVGVEPDMAPDMSGRGAPTVTRANLPMHIRRDAWAGYFRELYQPLDPPTGMVELKNASDAFDGARRADPSNLVALQHVFMILAETGRWADLRRVAMETASNFPEATQPLLARALASTRLHDMADASKAFDAAFQRMSAAERADFHSLHRLLPPRVYQNTGALPDSIQYTQSTPELRAQWEQLYWYMAEPRRSTGFNEAQLEFFARIAEADLLWSSDDLSMRGADSDRGRTLVRYGPPNWVYNIAGDQDLTLAWVYRNGLAFTFQMPQSYGVAYVPREDMVARDSIAEEVPVSWDNMKAVQRTVPMLTRATRFRGPRDSMDVVVAAAIPTLALLADSELGGGLPIDVHIDVADPQAKMVGRQVQQATVQGERLPTHINAWWERRLGPGLNVVRVEAEQKDVERSASGMEQVQVIDSAGFMLSDVLFTAPAKPREGTTPVRWTDLEIKPTVGVFSTDMPVGVVWENYGLSNENGNARYRVTLELERTFRNNLRGLGARIVANVRNVVQGSTRSGSLVVSYEELRPHGAAIVDHLAINLNESVAGTYRLTVTVEDLVAKMRTARTADFTLVK